jgi:hypothetical protein
MSLRDRAAWDWNFEAFPEFLKQSSKMVERTIPTNRPNEPIISVDANWPAGCEGMDGSGDCFDLRIRNANSCELYILEGQSFCELYEDRHVSSGFLSGAREWHLFHDSLDRFDERKDQ